jgi:hypothetical protein
MKLLEILRDSILNTIPNKSNPNYRELVSSFKQKGARVLGAGDYGIALELDSRVFKVTTDEIELEHAELLAGKQTKYFAKIYNVTLYGPKLGVIEMENLAPLDDYSNVTEEFIEQLEREASSLGIDPDELDIRVKSNLIKYDNFMKDPVTGSVKMVDV